MHIRDRIIDFRRVPAGSLRPHPQNWRKHPEEQHNALRGVLAEIGYVDALMARPLPDGSLQIIDGHLRAETTPHTEVPVLIVDLNDAEAAKVLATFDPLTNMATSDPEKLDSLLQQIETDSEALQAMLDELAKESGIRNDPIEIVEDEAPQPPEVPTSKPGDIWHLGEHRLLCGDSTNVSDVARLVEGRSFNAVISDPPYGVNYVGKTDEALPVCNDSPEQLRGILEGSLSIAFQLSMPGACWYIAAPSGPNFLDFAEVLTSLQVWRQTIVWAKQHFTLGHSDFQQQCEFILYGWKPGAAHHEPPDRKQSTLWQIPKPVANRDHPTMKPVALIAKALTNSTDVGDAIYDPFLGSGTSMIAAEQLGRVCYGLEINPAYCDVIVSRWEALTGRGATRGSQRPEEEAGRGREATS